MNKTKEQEIIDFLSQRVFDPILNSDSASQKVKAGINLTKGRMSRLSAEKMIHYFWSALATDNAIGFSKILKQENMPRFEDVFEEFRDKFNDTWLRT